MRKVVACHLRRTRVLRRGPRLVALIVALMALPALAVAQPVTSRAPGSAAPKSAPATSAAPAASGAPATSAAPANPHAPAGADAPANPHGPGGPGASGPNPHAPGGRTNPHASGANPHGAGGMPTEMPLPEDGGIPDASLQPGTIVVTLRDAEESPLPNTEFTLAVNHQSVARGDSKESLKGVTDESGKAVFTGLQYGSGHSYRVLASRGEASFDSGEFGMTDKAGVRAVLHLYDVTSDIDEAGILGKATITVTMKEDVLVVEVQATYMNRSPLAWVANQEIKLPEGFKAFNSPDGMSPTMVPTDQGATLRGTIPPGQSNIAYRFHIPLETDGDQSFPLPVLPNTAAAVIAVEASKKMALTVEGFDKIERVNDGSGKNFLAGRKTITQQDYAAGKFVPSATVTITGLPKRPAGAMFVVALALVAFVGGLMYALSRRDSRGNIAEERADLEEAKRALLGEFATLERARQRGDVGPKTYERVRQQLLDALARIVDRIERARGPFGAAPALATPYETDDEGDDDGEEEIRPPAKRERSKRPR